MTTKSFSRLVLLAGPSCVGKSPLVKALARFHPGLWKGLDRLVLYTSRDARPGETDGVDYHFRSRAQIASLSEHKHLVVLDVRGDLQALDLQELAGMLAKGDVLFEGNTLMGRVLQTHPDLEKTKRLSIFLSPISREEVIFLKQATPALSLRELVSEMMRRKLLRRTRRQKGELSLKDLENIERRAASAYDELGDAHHFDAVIPNHDGEESDNWDALYYPLGDARTAVLSTVLLMAGEIPAAAERWEEGLLSDD